MYALVYTMLLLDETKVFVTFAPPPSPMFPDFSTLILSSADVSELHCNLLLLLNTLFLFKNNMPPVLNFLWSYKCRRN